MWIGHKELGLREVVKERAQGRSLSRSKAQKKVVDCLKQHVLPCGCRVRHFNMAVKLVAGREQSMEDLECQSKGFRFDFILRQGDSRVTEELYFRKINMSAILRCAGMKKSWYEVEAALRLV